MFNSVKAKYNNVRLLSQLNIGNRKLFLKFPKKFRVEYDPTKDYYKVLEISQSADDKDIKLAFYKLAKAYHPDVYKGSADKFKEVNEAYEILSDKDKKLQYDASRKFNSFFGGKAYQQKQQPGYGQSNHAYNNYNRGPFSPGFNAGNFREDPIFKNFNDWFKGGFNTNSSTGQSTRSTGKQDYKSNFTSGKKYEFGKKYYEKNKNYFKTFTQSENSENFQKSKKEPAFGKKYYERNKKYYDTFKNKKDENFQNEHYYDNQNQYTDDGMHRGNAGMPPVSPVLMFIFSIFGVILGSIIIRRILYGPSQPNQYKREHTNPSNPYQQQNVKPNPEYTPQYNQYTKSNANYAGSNQMPQSIPFERTDKVKDESEFGMKDDPFYRK